MEGRQPSPEGPGFWAEIVCRCARGLLREIRGLSTRHSGAQTLDGVKRLAGGSRRRYQVVLLPGEDLLSQELEA